MAIIAFKSSKKTLIEAAIFSWFDVFPVQPLQKCQFQAKTLTIRPSFPFLTTEKFDKILGFSEILKCNSFLVSLLFLHVFFVDLEHDLYRAITFSKVRNISYY